MTVEGQNHDFEADIPLGLVGCDFRHGSSRWRSHLVLSTEERTSMVEELRRGGAVGGVAFLDTCNRNEWIFTARNPCWAGEILRAQMIKHWQGIKEKSPRPYVRVAGEAVHHVLRVAAGLESFVVGERQILSQFNKALERARHESTSSVHLNKLGSVAARIAHEVRERAEPTGGFRGIHDVVGKYVAEKAKEPATALVIGMGEIGRRVTGTLEIIPRFKVLKMNRTVSGGKGSRGNIIPLSKLAQTPADIILVCTAAPEPILTPALLPAGARLLLDLGIPSQIDRRTGEMPGVTRVDLDDLLQEERTATLSAEQIRRAGELIDRGGRDYAKFCLQRRFVSVLDSTRKKNEEFISTVLPEFVGTILPDAEPALRATMENRLRILIRNYTASIFQSINDSISLNE